MSSLLLCRKENIQSERCRGGVICTKTDQSSMLLIMISLIVFRITPPTYWRLLQRSVDLVTCGVHWKRPQKWKTMWGLWGCVKTDRWDMVLYSCKPLLVEQHFHCTEFCLKFYRCTTCSGFYTFTVAFWTSWHH